MPLLLLGRRLWLLPGGSSAGSGSSSGLGWPAKLPLLLLGGRCGLLPSGCCWRRPLPCGLSSGVCLPLLLLPRELSTGCCPCCCWKRVSKDRRAPPLPPLLPPVPAPGPA
jgi:hypothetical protein